MSVTIKLQWPPSANHYWANRVARGLGGRLFVQTFLTKKAKEFRAEVEARILERFGVLKSLTCRLSVSIVANVPDRRKRDLSNVLKATEDALTHAGVWWDDSLIDRLMIERGPVTPGGELLVTISKMPETQPTLFGGE